MARRDPYQHCTHLFDLAVLTAAHVTDSAQTIFDMHVADRVEGRTTATLAENGSERLCWHLDCTAIVGAGSHAGRDLRQLSKWKHDLPPLEAEWAVVLRRAVFVSGARQYVPPPGNETAFENRERMGVCFNYQLPQARDSTRTPDWHRDFSMSGDRPLEGLDAEAEFALMKP